MAEAAPRTEATISKSRWPGWIWAVPIAALGVVVWLGVRAWLTRGTDIEIDFANGDGIKEQTKVVYLGVDVGSVSGVALSKDHKSVVASVNIDDSASADLRSGTKFYLKNAKPSLSDLSSLRGVLSGPTIEMVPGSGQKTRRFTGIAGNPPAKLAEPVLFETQFDDDVGSIADGAPVKMRGFTVGEVVGTSLRIDAQTGAVTTPVILALDAKRFDISHAAGSPQARLSGVLAELVSHGLRAKLSQTPPLIGAENVVLQVEQNTTPAALQTNGPYPQIPSDSGSGGSVIAKLNSLPLAEIGSNLRDITSRVKTLVSSPQLSDSIKHLDSTVAELNKVIDRAGPQVTAAVADLRKTADAVDSTVAQARTLIGGSNASTNGNLQQSLRELTDAARSVRSLADYLDRHPESLIRGRGG
ncbi:MAG TPA: MlaD family protein [Rhizomicrobium sp.]|nr:MlaD family protein [Rhizomicrobium sp.]